MTEYTDDHDLLIRIDEKVNLLIDRLGDKADLRDVLDLRSSVHDHDGRIAKLERWVWIVSGALLVLQLLLQYLGKGGA